MRRLLVAFALCPEKALGGMCTVRAETTSNWPQVVAEALGARDANLSIAGATSNSHGPWPATASRACIWWVRRVTSASVSRGAAVHHQKDCFESAMALAPTFGPSHHTRA